jgi:hypothetical protein
MHCDNRKQVKCYSLLPGSVKAGETHGACGRR